jgi:hypothetical protein
VANLELRMWAKLIWLIVLLLIIFALSLLLSPTVQFLVVWAEIMCFVESLEEVFAMGATISRPLLGFSGNQFYPHHSQKTYVFAASWSP